MRRYKSYNLLIKAQFSTPHLWLWTRAHTHTVCFYIMSLVFKLCFILYASLFIYTLLCILLCFYLCKLTHRQTDTYVWTIKLRLGHLHVYFTLWYTESHGKTNKDLLWIQAIDFFSEASFLLFGRVNESLTAQRTLNQWYDREYYHKGF